MLPTPVTTASGASVTFTIASHGCPPWTCWPACLAALLCDAPVLRCLEAPPPASAASAVYCQLLCSCLEGTRKNKTLTTVAFHYHHHYHKIPIFFFPSIFFSFRCYFLTMPPFSCLSLGLCEFWPGILFRVFLCYVFVVFGLMRRK